jgi:hypothetical protein
MHISNNKPWNACVCTNGTPFNNMRNPSYFPQWAFISENTTRVHTDAEGIQSRHNNVFSSQISCMFRPNMVTLRLATGKKIRVYTHLYWNWNIFSSLWPPWWWLCVVETCNWSANKIYCLVTTGFILHLWLLCMNSDESFKVTNQFVILWNVLYSVSNSLFTPQFFLKSVACFQFVLKIFP